MIIEPALSFERGRRMPKYIYPAIFTPEENGQYSVRFPDLKNCFSGGDSLPEAMDMARDALCLMLYDMEEKGVELPAPSSMSAAERETEGEEFASLIVCDTIEYRKRFDNKAVKKTLTIPSWLNDMAERADINFSAALQNALKEALHIG